MIQRALAAEVPFAWVAADSVYGVGELETALRRAGKGYVLGVNSDHHFALGGKPAVAGTAGRSRKSSHLGTGSASRRARAPRARGSMTGPICELADLDAAEYDENDPGFGPAAC